MKCQGGIFRTYWPFKKHEHKTPSRIITENLSCKTDKGILDGFVNGLMKQAIWMLGEYRYLRRNYLSLLDQEDNTSVEYDCMIFSNDLETLKRNSVNCWRSAINIAFYKFPLKIER